MNCEGSMVKVRYKNEGFITGERKKQKVKEVEEGGERHSKMKQINEKCKSKGVK